MTYVPLHCHTEFSLLDGFLKIPEAIAFCREHDMPSVGITDHGTAYGWIPYLKECKKQGIKPIVGVEMYHAADRRDRETRSPYHLTVLAKNQVGLGNLIKLVSLSNTEGFFYKPRVDFELLERHHDGLIVLSGCIKGVIPQLLLQGECVKARQIAEWFGTRFGDDFYLEVQRHPALTNVIHHPNGRVEEIDEFERALQLTVDLSRGLGIGLVATTDSHYLRPEDEKSHSILMQIGTGGNLKGIGPSYHVHTPEEMASLFKDLPEALDNTLEIYERIEPVHLQGKVMVPAVPGVVDDNQTLRGDALAGLTRLYGDPLPEPYQGQLEYELSVIQECGFSRYLLLVAEVARWARGRGISCGPRGSAAGSLVCHGLGISPIDPLRHGLIFDRFLSRDRIQMPDIDMDFADDRRSEVIGHIRDTYGSDRVASISTFGTLGTKAVLKDVGNILGFDYGQINELTKGLRSDATLDDVQAEHESIKDLVGKCRPLEGLHRHVSTHAAGIVVSSDSLPEIAPCLMAKGQLQVQYDMDGVEEAGLLKLDVLGLDYLTVVDRCLSLIERNRGERVDLENIPMDDPAVYEMLTRGRVHGVFQISGEGMKRSVRMMRPSSIDDLMALVALYRPGPMEYIQQYCDVKHGIKPFKSPHPLLDDIVRDTHSVIIYQESIIAIARKVAGFSYGEADVLRKAIGKKIQSLLLEQKDKFVAGAVSHSHLQVEQAESIWTYFEPFARYGFSKSHACAYSYLTYRTAWLKNHYPLEYMCALLDCHSDDQSKVTVDIREAMAMGLTVLPPDASCSGIGFTIEGDAIRMGLGCIKGVGEAARAVIDNAPYADVPQVFRKLTRVKRDALEAMIKVGVFGPIKRSVLLQALPVYTRAFGKEKSSQMSLFDTSSLIARPPDDLPEATEEEITRWEREYLGFAVSDRAVERLVNATGALSLGDAEIGTVGLFAGRLSDLRILVTRRDSLPFVKGFVEDTSGQMAFVCFPRVYERTQEVWLDSGLAVVEGKVGEYNGERQLVVTGASSPESAPLSPVTVRIDLDNPGEWLSAWRLALSRPGEVPLTLVLANGEDDVSHLQVMVDKSCLDRLTGIA
jgi:DNA polymerase-3 subunit alpha